MSTVLDQLAPGVRRLFQPLGYTVGMRDMGNMTFEIRLTKGGVMLEYRTFDIPGANGELSPALLAWKAELEDAA